MALVFHRVAEVLRDNYPQVRYFVDLISENVFFKAPSRVTMLKGMYSEIPLPPKPILTKWGTWTEAI